MSPDFLENVAAAVGQANLLTSHDDRVPFDTDWRGVLDGRSLGVVRPSRLEEVTEIVRLCAKNSVRIVPQGGNTGMCGGATPDNSAQQLVVSLTRMRAIRELDITSNCMTVEAGLSLIEAQQAAAGDGLMMPLSIASEGSATIGGAISTNAGGINVLRYGNMRDLTLGIEVVLADGTIWSDLKKLHKNNTGYDLKQLFIGGEGTLGIVTAACIKLHHPPSSRLTFLAGIKSVQSALTSLNDIHGRFGNIVESWELFSDVSANLLARNCGYEKLPLQATHPWYLLGEIALYGDGDEDIWDERLVEMAGRMQCDDIVLAMSQSQRESLWAIRENISEAERAQGKSIKHDVSVPTGAIPDLIARVLNSFETRFADCQINIFGHVGDGNLHINAIPREIGAQIGADTAAAISEFVYDATAALDGSFSAEHGIGSMKTAQMAKYKEPPALELMRQIKAALDPMGIFNPGKVLT